MRSIKMLTLLVVAAMVATAFVGASSVSANSETIVLCEKAELECENPWPNPTTIVGHATNPKMLTSIGTIECEKSLAEITLLNELKHLIFGHLLALSFEKCHLGKTSCTVTVTELGGAAGVHGPNPLEAIVTVVPLMLEVKGEEVPMNTFATLKCGALVNCTFTAGEAATASITSSEAGEVSLILNQTELRLYNGFCPEIAKADAVYNALGTGYYIES